MIAGAAEAIMDTRLEFHLCHGQAMRDLREAAASTPRVSLGDEGEMLLIFTKPDGALVLVTLRDMQEHWVLRRDFVNPKPRQG